MLLENDCCSVLILFVGFWCCLNQLKLVIINSLSILLVWKSWPTFQYWAASTETFYRKLTVSVCVVLFFSFNTISGPKVENQCKTVEEWIIIYRTHFARHHFTIWSFSFLIILLFLVLSQGQWLWFSLTASVCPTLATSFILQQIERSCLSTMWRFLCHFQQWIISGALESYMRRTDLMMHWLIKCLALI